MAASERANPRRRRGAPTGPDGHRSVVVVGATSGIGLKVARLLAERGDRLLLVARDADRLAEVARSLPTEPDRVAVAAADVVDEAAVSAAVEACVRAHGRVDAVVTTAQVMAYGSLEQVPAEVVRHLADVAISGPLHLARAVLPHFRAQGGGVMVVVGSLLGEIAVPGMGAYCTAKWGQEGLVRTLQTEVRRMRGVHVSLVLPGATDTPIYQQAATWAGSRGSAPPPVRPAAAVARACVECLDRPRRRVHVGPVNLPAVATYRLAGPVYELVAGPLVQAVVLRGPRVGVERGNIDHAVPEGEAVSGGWTLLGLLRRPGRRARWSR